MHDYKNINLGLVNRVKQYLPTPVRQLIQPKPLHAFCIGTPKSGTTSIAGIFDKNFRASHEPERRELITLIKDHYDGLVSDEYYVQWLITRNKRNWLDLESNCFLGYRADLLYRAFPNAKYILSVREPESWLDSMMNHTINYSPSSELVIKYWHGIFFQPTSYPHKTEDSELINDNVYSVEAYLKYWEHSIRSILDVIPQKQLLIVKTHEFDQKIETIANFLGVDSQGFDMASGHKNKAPKKYQLAEKVAPGYIQNCIQEYCRPLCNKLGL